MHQVFRGDQASISRARLQPPHYLAKSGFFSEVKNPGLWEYVATTPTWKWWQTNIVQFYPDLAQVAIVSSGGTSNSTKYAERSYGEQDYVASLRRNALKPERTDDLMFCYHNLRLLRAGRATTAEGTNQLVPWQWQNHEEAEEQPLSG